MKEKRITHRNINMKCFLLTKNLVVKLTNFGDSKQMKYYNDQKPLHSIHGDPDYQSPEIFDVAKGYNGYSVDLFAAGKVLLKII
jgi:serine/threonine protein kinase